MEETDVCVMMDRFGYVRCVDQAVYDRNQEAAAAESRFVVQCKNVDKLCLFTDKGNMYQVRVLDLPYGKFRDKAIPIDNYCQYSSAQERILYMEAIENIRQKQLIFVTKTSMCKLVNGAEFAINKKTSLSTKLAVDDELVMVGDVSAMEHLVLQSRQGFFLRMLLSEVPEKKKAALGVRGMRLAPGDELENAFLLASRVEYTVNIQDKPLTLNRLKLAKRDTKGTKVRR